jgi:hypothetical protein
MDNSFQPALRQVKVYLQDATDSYDYDMYSDIIRIREVGSYTLFTHDDGLEDVMIPTANVKKIYTVE